VQVLFWRRAVVPNPALLGSSSPKTYRLADRSAKFVIPLVPIGSFDSLCAKEDSRPFSRFVPWASLCGEPMEAQKVDVLLIRKGQTGHSPLSNRLARRGCDCRFATSHQEIGAALASHLCDLVLAPVRLHGDSLYPLIDQLHGSRSTLFYYLIVEDGCWWLPAVWLGANCFGAPAIHNREFVTVLDQTIDAIRFSARALVDPRSRLASHPSDSRLIFPFPRKIHPPAPPASAKIPKTTARKASR
jgi:hypothetical protein